MNKKDNKFKANIIGGFCVAIVGILGALWLLIDREAISGAEFVALSLGFSVIGLIIAFAAEIQEFSIAGNGVKLKELRSEAEKTIEELKEARTELFRVLMKNSINLRGGGTSISQVDLRVDNFINLFEKIKKFEIIDSLKIDIQESLNNILVDQFNGLTFIHRSSKNVGDNFGEKDAPQFLYMELNEEKIRNSPKFNIAGRPDMKYEDIKDDVMNAIEAYAKLYAIKVKLDNLETDHA